MSAQADPFALFELPRRYEIDRGALDAAYERLTLAHHPDFFSTAPAEEKAEAERISAAVNEGYRLLRDDRARAAYLLRVLADGRELDTQALPQGFLQEMFGLQEEVEELADDGDPVRIAQLREEADAQRGTLLAERTRLFAEAEEGQRPPLELLQAIQSNLNCERYLQRLLERLDGGGEGAMDD